MSHGRFVRCLSILLVLLALTTLVTSVGRAAQGPAIPERLPGGSPFGPLSLERYRPPENEEGQEDLPLEDPAGVYGMNWSRIVFQSARNERDYNIYIATPDGYTSVKKLTGHSAHDMMPRLNRGATEIVFTSNRTGNWELYRMNSSGGDLRQLTFNGSIDAEPCWSPDGQQIAFASTRSGQYEVYVMNRDGSNLRRLTNNAAYDGEPSWSPDGSKIAFTSSRSGGYRIWVMNADGSGATMLNWERSSGRPSWSPDGQKIAFHADGDNDTWFDIFVMNANGSNHVKLYNGYGWSSGGYDGYAGNWSPDGRYISYTNVNWIKYQGNWYWETARPKYLDASSGSGGDFNSAWNLAWYPDWQTADVDPPNSQVFPLATYSRDHVEVTWTAADVGQADLDQVLVQYRVGESGAWTLFSDTANEYSWRKIFEKQSGETVYFRSRAKDKAGNMEAWPADGFDTKTTFYDWTIDGRIGDNRGQPLAGATLVAGPEAFEVYPSDADGNYKAYFKGADYSFSPSWSKDGYGQLPETPFLTDHDRGFDVVLPPADNMVADWGFESGALDGDPWQTTGIIAPAVGEAYRHTGGFGVFLGLPADLAAPDGVVQAAWKSSAGGGGYVLNHTQPKTAATNDVSGISQQVTIPLTLTNPTVSMMVSLQGGQQGSNAKLMAQINDGSGPVTVLEADAVSSWVHQWADLSAYAGETVTLTVQVQQEAGVPQLGAMVDEVTLGSAPPDLWVALSGPLSAETGYAFNLALQYGNRAPSLASGIEISLTLPASLTYVSAVPAPVETTPALIWEAGDLASIDPQAPIVITATMDAAFDPDLLLTSLAEIKCEEIEIEMTNNIDSFSIRVGRLVLLPMIVR